MVVILALVTMVTVLWLFLSCARPRTALIAAALMGTLAGCGPQYVWVKPGATSANWNVDWTDCRVYGIQAVPQNQQATKLSNGYQEPAFTSCSKFGASIDCTTTGGGSVAPTYIAYDANSGLRDDAIRLCMLRKNWQLMDMADYKAQQARNSNLAEDGTEKWIVIEGGFCNNTDDCIRGLQCGENKCQRPGATHSAHSSPKKKSVTAGGFCPADDFCQAGLKCSNNSCVVDFQKSR